MKPSASLDNTSQYDFGHLAGIWSEPISVVGGAAAAPTAPPHDTHLTPLQRTYVMFVPASSRGCSGPGGQVPHLDAEISRTGLTMRPSCWWSISYALGSTPITHSSWHMLAMTFDGGAIRAYVNGSLDVREPDAPHRTPSHPACNERWQNPAPIATWTNRTPGTWGPGGAPASTNTTDFTVGGQRGEVCPDGEPCSGMGHPWSGLLGGLAIYDRALGAAELRAMAMDTGFAPLY